MAIRGLALGCTMQPTTLTALAAVPAELQTNASSLVTAMRSIWQSFGIAMLATVVQTQSGVHAAVLGFVHPITGEALRFVSPLPEDLARLQAGLERL